MLYVMTFCLPRFLEQSFDDKFVTIFHELFHIGPSFDGDFRRHSGRCAFYGALVSDPSKTRVVARRAAIG